jgi:hypothetical protein
MSNNTRQSGWYRVKVKKFNEWTFAYYYSDSKDWNLKGDEVEFYDHELEINEKLLNPNPSQPIINE